MNESSVYGEITSIQRDGSRCYLIMESSDLPQLPYQINMIRYNNIKEILPIQFLIEDGKYRYYYDISGKVPLQTFMNQKRYTYKEIRTIMSDLYRCVQQLDEYLLSQDALILDPDYMYTDPEEMRISFCFYPDKKTDFQSSLISLFDFFINHINYQDEDTVVLAYGLYQKSREENAALREVMEQFVTKGSSRSSRGVREDGQAAQNPDNADPHGRREGDYGTDQMTYNNEGNANMYSLKSGNSADPADPSGLSGSVKYAQGRGPGQTYYKGGSSNGSRVRNRFSREAAHAKKTRRSGKKLKESGQKSLICYMPDFIGFVLIALILRYMYLHRSGISIRLTALLLFAIAAVTGICLTVSSYLENRMREEEPDAMDPEDTSSYDRHGTYQDQQQYMGKMSSAYDQSDWPDPGSEELSFTAPEEADKEDTLRLEEDRMRRQSIDDFPDLRTGPAKEQEPEPAQEPVNPIPKTVILNREDMFWMHYPALISTEKDKRPDIMLKNRSNIVGKVREAVDVCIEGQGISRIHAKLAFSDGNCFLTDLGSTNGTYVNGSRIEQGERHQLEEGDEIRFADAGYVYKPA